MVSKVTCAYGEAGQAGKSYFNFLGGVLSSSVRRHVLQRPMNFPPYGVTAHHALDLWIGHRDLGSCAGRRAEAPSCCPVPALQQPSAQDRPPQISTAHCGAVPYLPVASSQQPGTRNPGWCFPNEAQSYVAQEMTSRDSGNAVRKERTEGKGGKGGKEGKEGKEGERSKRSEPATRISRAHVCGTVLELQPQPNPCG
jgi:hypothetical protein